MISESSTACTRPLKRRIGTLCSFSLREATNGVQFHRLQSIVMENTWSSAGDIEGFLIIVSSIDEDNIAGSPKGTFARLYGSAWMLVDTDLPENGRSGVKKIYFDEKT